jgi:hypothetical protein
MEEDLSDKDWTQFMKLIHKIIEDLQVSLSNSKQKGIPVDESVSCRLYIWFITNLFQERLFRNLQMNPNDMDEKLHKAINEIIKFFEVCGEKEEDFDMAETLMPSPLSLKGRTWQERNEWSQLWINTGKYLLVGKNATNENAIYREIRYCPYTKILSAWITEIWIYGYSIIEYLAITLHFTDRFFNENDIVEAIKMAQIYLNIKDNKIVDDWEFIKRRIQELA